MLIFYCHFCFFFLLHCVRQILVKWTEACNQLSIAVFITLLLRQFSILDYHLKNISLHVKEKLSWQWAGSKIISQMQEINKLSIKLIFLTNFDFFVHKLPVIRFLISQTSKLSITNLGIIYENNSCAVSHLKALIACIWELTVNLFWFGTRHPLTGWAQLS